MLYVYDEAIAEDIANCINPKANMNDMVKVIGPEGIMPIIAEMKEDKIQFPLICLMRNAETPIDTQRTNFRRMQRAVPAVVDTKTNMIYDEKAIPIKLGYTVSILTTNTADSDELLREMLFKYIDGYFVTIQLPYEFDRKVRIGIDINHESIEKKSGNLEYIQGGKLYETSFDINCEGAMIVTYVPRHICRAMVSGVEVEQ